MHVRVLLFAALREAAGTRETELDLAAGATVADLRAELAARFPRLEPILARAAVAINETYADADATLHDGDTAGFIPPVSGG